MSSWQAAWINSATGNETVTLHTNRLYLFTTTKRWMTGESKNYIAVEILWPEWKRNAIFAWRTPLGRAQTNGLDESMQKFSVIIVAIVASLRYFSVDQIVASTLFYRNEWQGGNTVGTVCNPEKFLLLFSTDSFPKHFLHRLNLERNLLERQFIVPFLRENNRSETGLVNDGFSRGGCERWKAIFTTWVPCLCVPWCIVECRQTIPPPRVLSPMVAQPNQASIPR